MRCLSGTKRARGDRDGHLNGVGQSSALVKHHTHLRQGVAPLVARAAQVRPVWHPAEGVVGECGDGLLGLRGVGNMVVARTTVRPVRSFQ